MNIVLIVVDLFVSLLAMDANLLIDSLAREGRLQEARRVGEEAVAADPHDDAALSALVGVYLEIESQCISTGVTCYLAEIDRRLDELIASMADGEMERRRHERLRLAQQPGYDELSRLEALSARDGYEQEAYEKAHAMFVAGNMSPGLHEIYATIIYRYARVAMTDPSSRPVRSLLFEYLGLPVRKPSRVHSLASIPTSISHASLICGIRALSATRISLTPREKARSQRRHSSW